MKEKEFRQILDLAWNAYVKAFSLVNMLEGIGLDVNPDCSDNDGGPKFGDLYGLQTAAVDSVVNTVPVPGPTVHHMLDILDGFFSDLATEYYDCTGFPDEKWDELLELFHREGLKLPWEKERFMLVEHPNYYYRHRGLAKKDMQPVIGYLWNGVDHSYIIPETFGIDYNDLEERLKAYAVEVWQPTIALESQMTDLNGKRLFIGDEVRIGDRQFVLRLDDPAAMEMLSSEGHYRLGLFLVHPNYYRFQPSKK